MDSTPNSKISPQANEYLRYSKISPQANKYLRYIIYCCVKRNKIASSSEVFYSFILSSFCNKCTHIFPLPHSNVMISPLLIIIIHILPNPSEVIPLIPTHIFFIFSPHPSPTGPLPIRRIKIGPSAQIPTKSIRRRNTSSTAPDRAQFRANCIRPVQHISFFLLNKILNKFFLETHGK